MTSSESHTLKSRLRDTGFQMKVKSKKFQEYSIILKLSGQFDLNQFLWIYQNFKGNFCAIKALIHIPTTKCSSSLGPRSRFGEGDGSFWDKWVNNDHVHGGESVDSVKMPITRYDKYYANVSFSNLFLKYEIIYVNIAIIHA